MGAFGFTEMTNAQAPLAPALPITPAIDHHAHGHDDKRCPICANAVNIDYKVWEASMVFRAKCGW